MTPTAPRRPPTGTSATEAAADLPETRAAQGRSVNLGRRPPQFRRPRHPHVPTIAALLTAVVGIVDLASAVTPEIAARLRVLRDVVPGTLSHVAVAATTLIGLLLLLLAHALRRRKRRAWRAVVALLLISVVGNLVKGLDYEEAALALALLAGMIAYRGEFLARGDRRTRWRALGAFIVLTVASVLLGLVLFAVRRGAVATPRPSLWVQVQTILAGLIGVPGPVGYINDRATDLFGDFFLGLGILIVLVTGYLALRPSEPAPTHSSEDEARMRALLAKHGERDSLGYFALRRDKSVLWSPSGKAAIAYRVLSGVILASGDPIGDPEAWPGAIARFLEEATAHAWVPAVIGCSEAAGRVYARHGLAALELGDEAIIDVADFTLEGRAMRNVRQTAGRVERAGYRCEVRRVGDIPPAERAALWAQAEAWRGTASERGFSMALGRFGDESDGDCVAVLAYQDDDHGDPRLRALLHFVPWGRTGLSLDLMRRDRSADGGLNEFMIVTTIRCAPALGVNRISLNFAVFRSALERGERLGAGPVLRLWRALLVFVSRWFQIESLYRFNTKFRPIWEPRFICYPTARDIPRVAVAALEAEAFLARPRLAGLAMPRPRVRPRHA